MRSRETRSPGPVESRRTKDRGTGDAPPARLANARARRRHGPPPLLWRRGGPLRRERTDRDRRAATPFLPAGPRAMPWSPTTREGCATTRRARTERTFSDPPGPLVLSRDRENTPLGGEPRHRASCSYGPSPRTAAATSALVRPSHPGRPHSTERPAPRREGAACGRVVHFLLRTAHVLRRSAVHLAFHAPGRSAPGFALRSTLTRLRRTGLAPRTSSALPASEDPAVAAARSAESHRTT